MHLVAPCFLGEKDLPDGGVFLSKPYTAKAVTAAIQEFTG
jgi:hypothetical protein